MAPVRGCVRVLDVDPALLQLTAYSGIQHAPLVDVAVGVITINRQPFFVTRVGCALGAVLRSEASISLTRDTATSSWVVRKLDTISKCHCLKTLAAG